jgi:hypothetical protein
MAVNNWAVSFLDGSWVIDDNDLGKKFINFFGRVNHSITSNTSSFNIVGSNFYIESNIVSRVGNFNLLVVHLNGLNFTLNVSWSEDNVGFLLKDTSFNSTNGDGTKAFNFINIVDWDSQRFFSGSFWGFKQVNGLD